jgi:hypothetical protein
VSRVLTLEALLAMTASVAINFAAMLYTSYAKRRVERLLFSVKPEGWGSGGAPS